MRRPTGAPLPRQRPPSRAETHLVPGAFTAQAARPRAALGLNMVIRKIVEALTHELRQNGVGVPTTLAASPVTSTFDLVESIRVHRRRQPSGVHDEISNKEIKSHNGFNLRD